MNNTNWCSCQKQQYLQNVCYIKEEIESKDAIPLKETLKHADNLTLAESVHLLSRFVLLSIHKPFVFDVHYLNQLLSVKVGLRKRVISERNKQKITIRHNKNLGFFVSYRKSPLVNWGFFFLWETEKMFWNQNTELKRLTRFTEVFQHSSGTTTGSISAAAQCQMPSWKLA